MSSSTRPGNASIGRNYRTPINLASPLPRHFSTNSRTHPPAACTASQGVMEMSATVGQPDGFADSKIDFAELRYAASLMAVRMSSALRHNALTAKKPKIRHPGTHQELNSCPVQPPALHSRPHASANPLPSNQLSPRLHPCTHSSTRQPIQSPANSPFQERPTTKLCHLPLAPNTPSRP